MRSKLFAGIAIAALYLGGHSAFAQEHPDHPGAAAVHDEKAREQNLRHDENVQRQDAVRRENSAHVNEMRRENSARDNEMRRETSHEENAVRRADSHEANVIHRENVRQVHMEREQRTHFVDVIRRQNITRVEHLDFVANVGVPVPVRYHYYPLPAEIVSFVPQYSGYYFLIADGNIIIIDPATRQIVDIIPQV